MLELVLANPIMIIYPCYPRLTIWPFDIPIIARIALRALSTMVYWPFGRVTFI